jgi:hypothetical protein
MTWIALMVYVGGFGAAYRKDRRYFGRFQSALEAFVWPCGVGNFIASRFYVNSDWPEAGRSALKQEGKT